jgi:alkylation response protein AidB-like acyl-CoA dehydrogenase
MLIRPFAEKLEQALGSRMPFSRAVELDEREEFPEEFAALLREVGAHHYLIPRELGGALESFEENILNLRLIARRDLTTAIAFGQTFLGAIPVWLAGSEAQRQWLARAIRDGALCCLALTEEEHGGDLLACEFQALRAGQGFLLNGRKWLINNGSRAGALTVFARTGDKPGPAAFTLFLVERTAAGPAAVSKVRTHGIRGADISGVACHDLAVPESSVVGGVGRGYEITLKTLQISRTLCAALSLGAADTALHTALDFALHRQVFGGTVAAIPAARDALANAYADLLICECLASAAGRALHVAVDRMALWSAVVKYLVPTLVDEIIRDTAAVLGARHYLRESHHAGIFQKVMRDHAVVGLFDGSTAVNLHILSGQLGALAAKRNAGADARLAVLFDLARPIATRGFPHETDMRYTSDGRDEIVEGLLEAQRHRLPEPIAGLAGILAAELQRIDETVRTTRDLRPNSTARFHLARQYCLVHAGAACVLAWLHGRKGNWVIAALHRLTGRLHPTHAGAPEAVLISLFEELRAQRRAPASLSQ